MLSQSQFHNLIRQFLCFGRIGSGIYFYCQLAAGWSQTPCVILLVQVAVCLNQKDNAWGLDYAEKYRNLPYIGILKPHVYGGEGE